MKHAAVRYLKQVRINQAHAVDHLLKLARKFVDLSSSHVLLTGRIISTCVESSGANVHPRKRALAALMLIDMLEEETQPTEKKDQ